MEQTQRVLHVTEKLQAAGIESFIMNTYRNINKEKLQFDFLVMRNQKEFYDDEIRKLGGIKYTINKMYIKSTFLRVILESIELYKFLKKNDYKCIHIHSGTPLRVFYLVSAKLAKTKIRIYHSHSAEVLGPHKNLNLKKMLFKIFSNMLPLYATDFFACSEAAAKWMYPKRILKDVKIIHNGINIEKFKFDPKIRKKYREDLNLTNNFVIGHIGRFNDQKNHTFLIDIFSDVYEKNNEAKLLLIGEGKLKEKIQEKVKSLGLEKSVIFLGIRDDVNKIMQAMDVFVLPSNYEGLPVVGIEAQASGLQCVLSVQITKEVDITNNVCFLPIIDKSIWSDKIIQIEGYKREDTSKEIIKSKYDINSVSKEIEEFYISNLKQ